MEAQHLAARRAPLEPCHPFAVSAESRAASGRHQLLAGV